MSTLPVVVTVRNTSGLTTTANASIEVTDSAPRGLITAFNPAPNNWGNPEAMVIDGQQFFVETAGRAWSLTKLDDYTIRFELRPGDVWNEDETSRSEILTVRNADDNSVFKCSYNMMVEPGTVNSLDWLTAVQMHEDGGIPFSISLLNDQMNVLTDQAEDWGTQPYVDPNQIVRGRTYAMKIEARFSNSTDGYLKMWRDGVQIVNYTGRLGSETNGQYIKFGIYAGYPSRVTSPIVIRYDHIALDFADPPPPPPPPPLPPGINQVGVTTIGPTADDGNVGEILGQMVVLGSNATLQSLSFYLGTASGNIRLGLYRDNNGRPGAKVAEASSVAAVVGWNTRPVTASLTAGTYWLVFELSSNAARGRLTNSGTAIYASQAYGTLPATFPAGTLVGNTSFSFYMTVNV